MFEKKPIKKKTYTKSSSSNTKRGIKRKYTRKKLSKFKKQPGKYIFKICIYLFLLFLVFGFISSVVLYNKYLKDLPPVSELQNYEFAEASTIYDRNGVELYKFFEEKRTYVEYDQINKNMINALVAGEDKRFWDNAGIDLIGISRAAVYYLTGKTDRPEGTSTLTQQLVRNTIISNETTVERKIKEIYLALKINKELEKPKILELYLNKIEFGSNAFGIEQASKTFFNKSAIDLNILESSMLASLPKTPTGLSPYNYPHKLVGYPYHFPKEDTENITKIVSQTDKNNNIDSTEKLKEFILSIKGKPLAQSDKILLCGLDDKDFKNNMRIDSQGCSTQDYSKLLHFLNSIQLDNGETLIEYQTGRKDFILGRMLEDEYINFDEYKQAIVDGFGYKFNKARENIKAPHFVFYVKKYLEDIYGPELVSKGGLKIYTTLDYSLQEKAQEIVTQQAEINTTKYNAKNAAVLTLDNKNGEIITMVGSKDYFDEDINGKVNINTSLLQPGSTFKPFVYSIATYKNAIGSKTPVYDVETQFPNYKPQNFDGKFRGKMDFSTALNESRNIPAIKMFYMAGGESSIVGFMKTIGVKSLKEHNMYGAPLALGTGEMEPMELATAYSVFANNGQLKEFTPVLKIEDSYGNLIYNSQETENIGKQVISKGQTYLMNTVLSDTSTRPTFWNNYLALNNRPVAAKTGTSTKQYEERGNKIIYPSNLWTVGYTPQYTTVAWAGNTNGEKLNFKGSGLEGAGPIFKKVMEAAHNQKPVERWTKPSDAKNVKISSVSGLLPSEKTADGFIVDSLFLNTPTSYDYSFQNVQVDALCNGKVTSKTPEAAVKNLTVVQFNSLNPKNASWQNPVLAWAKSDKAKALYGSYDNFVTSVNDYECERSDTPSKITLSNTIKNDDIFTAGLNNISVTYESSNPVRRIDVLLEGQILHSFDIDNRFNGTLNEIIRIPDEHTNSKKSITTRVVDIQYYSNEVSNKVYIIGKDQIDPEITITNPSDLYIRLYKGTTFNLRGTVKDRSPIRTINVYINDERYKIGIEGPDFIVPIDSSDLDLGIHTIRVEAIDYGFNKVYENVRLTVLEQ